uniref:IS1634 family transposase n=1 Tax=Mycolicibacterium sp. TUM20984 TaxID=3023368 RepID=UPI0024E069DF|nr:IS1634 family transposase [Mycolicibacterium sp. TUM20984]
MQIVWSSRRGSRSIEHLGSAHDESELAALKAAAAERLAANQTVLDLGVTAPPGSQPLPITSSQMTHLWGALCAAYRILGFESATKSDIVFRDLVLARIIEPSSKIDAERVLTEVGVASASYATLKRLLPIYAQPRWRQSLAAASARRANLGPASLVLFDVSTLYFETDAGDGFREPGFSKERRLEPQITIGLLADASGSPLALEAFEGNKAETATMLPVINAFKAAHQLIDVTVVADAGMISETNQIAMQAAGLTYILGARIPFLPDVVREWRDTHPEEAIPDQLVLTQPWPATSSEKARGIPDRVTHYQFRHDRARRSLRGIDEQVAKAQRAVDGKAAVKRNRFIKLTGATKSVNRELEAKTRALAGWKGYTTNLVEQTPDFVIGAYHQLWRIEKAFRMSKHDLQARPIYHHMRESIDAHLTVVFAAMAVSHYIETQTGWSIKKFVRTARRYRTVKINAGGQILTAADPLTDELRDALTKIRTDRTH